MLTLPMSDAILTGLTAHVVAGDFDGALRLLEVGLYKAPIDPSPTTVIGNLVEADFTGYARIALTPWTAPVLPDSSPYWAVNGPLMSFTNTDPAANQSMYGYFLADVATHMILYAVQPFATPAVIRGASANVTIGLQAILDPIWEMLRNVME